MDDPRLIIDGILMYLGIVVLLTFHEFGHAWMAWKCGDDTARLQGRVSLNPLVHIDLIGTVAIPLLMIFLSLNGSVLSRFLIGWAKPVPVNPSNLRNPRMDDVLITLAGPWMNLVLAVALVAIAKLAAIGGAPNAADLSMNMARISLLLFYFNLLPIPPLDGSRIARVLINMSYETYYQIARYGFIVLIIAINLPTVQNTIRSLTDGTMLVIKGWFAMS
jgi:Zn-dependent protease